MRHHLDEGLLLEYAAGAARPSRALLAATHLALCSACRARAAELETVGGALLAALPPADIGAELLAATLARLDAPAPMPTAPRTDPDGVLPPPLAALLGPFRRLPWRRVFPAVEELLVPTGDREGMPARLFRLAAGSFVPAHQHVGEELSLVLTGGFTDDEGHFGRGDVATRGEQGVHRQAIDPGEPCVVLVVADAPLRPRSAVALVASWIRRF